MKKWKPLSIITIAGALLATEIGSGFASGQETMQFYTAYGWGSVLVGIMTMLITYFTFEAYAYAGRTRDLKTLREVCCFYGGKYLGRLFEIFAWLFATSCYVFMISGFGAVLNQQWGIPTPAGSAIGTALAVLTAVMGLKNIVNVIGKIGPLIALFTLVIGVVSAFTYYPKISEGIALLKSGAVTVTAGSTNSFTAGLSIGGCTVLLCATMVATLAYNYREYKFNGFRLCIGICAVVIPGVSLIMGLNLLGAISEVHNVAIPNMILASKLLGPVGMLFTIVIILAIYTTICPLLWTALAPFLKDQGNNKYRIACVLVGIAVWIITIAFDYATLLNWVMTYGGYCGAFAAVVCIGRYLYIRQKDKSGISDGVSTDVAE